jgi:hypothetical protein
MSQMLDPTFSRSPAEAIVAPPERLAYVAAYDPAGRAKDALAVLAPDPRFFPNGDDFRGLRVHQTRLQGGDASNDSYCHSS